MASGLPSGRMVIVVASFALCCAVDFAPWLSSASGFPPAAHRLPPAGRSPRQQIPPPSAPPGPTQALPAVRDSGRATKGTAVIRGTVYAGDTGTPLRRARVAWSSGIPYSPGGGADTRPVVMTDTNGRYEIRNLPAGRYHVLARRSGYLQMEFAARRGTGATKGAVADADRGIAIELTDGQTFGGADFVLPRAAAIAGRIVDEVGDPVMGAFVGAGRVETAGGRRRMVAYASDITDDQGEYRLFGLPPGSYCIVSSVPNSLRSVYTDATYPDMFFPGVPRRDQATTVAARIGQEVAQVNFALSPMRLGRIAGNVTTSTGMVPRATSFVLVHRADTGISETRTYSPAAMPDGAFSLGPVPPGNVELIVTATTDRGIAEVGSMRLFVGGDDVTGLLVRTGPEGRLFGSVRTDTGAPLPFQATAGSTTAVRVTANAVEDGTNGVVSTSPTSGQVVDVVSSSGAFSVGVRPGTRLIGLAGLPAGWGVAAVLLGDRTITDAPIDVEPGTSRSVQLVISNRLPEIAGRAVDGQERPTWDYTALLFPREPSRCYEGSPLVRSERPNQRGEFRLDRVVPGEYYVAAVGTDEDVDLLNPDEFDRLRSRSTPLTVALGDKKTVLLRIARSSEGGR